MNGGWIALLAAPFVGSTLGVLIRRLPMDKPDLWGRSACESCGHTLLPHEMVPLLSYALQRGRCRACGARIATERREGMGWGGRRCVGGGAIRRGASRRRY